MKNNSLILMALSALALLAACEATPLRSEAQSIRILSSEPKNCQYLGEVTGNQGNRWSGGWTSNENLETGARNEMKNKAAHLGGNVIVLLTNRAGQTGSYGFYGGSSQQTNVTYTGTVYRCGRSSSASVAKRTGNNG